MLFFWCPCSGFLGFLWLFFFCGSVFCCNWEKTNKLVCSWKLTRISWLCHLFFPFFFCFFFLLRRRGDLTTPSKAAAGAFFPCPGCTPLRSLSGSQRVRIEVAPAASSCGSDPRLSCCAPVPGNHFIIGHRAILKSKLCLRLQNSCQIYFLLWFFFFSAAGACGCCFGQVG